MDSKIYEKIILGNFNPEQEKKYVIYGTGKVADVFYEKITIEIGEEHVLCFINEKEDLETYHEKEVKKCIEIEDEYKTDDVIYILATISKIPLFRKKLLEINIDELNIWHSTTAFSQDYFEEDSREIKRVVVYPPIQSEEQLMKLTHEFDLYSVNGSKKNEYIFLTEKNINVNCQYTITNFMQYEFVTGDLIWVWRAEATLDNYLKDKRFICCDDDFLYHSEERMHMILNNKINQVDFNQINMMNWDKLCQKAEKFKYATVCGMGPSLRDMNEKTKRFIQKGFVIVCNNFYDVEKKIKAHVYVLQDNDYLGEDYREELYRIIDFIVQNQMFLVVDNRWVNFLLKLFPNLSKLVIGLEHREMMCFPNEKELVYHAQDNVIPALCLPVAAGLFDEIYILGCDGHTKDGEWAHSNGEINKKDVFSDRHFLMINNTSTIIEYEQKVTEMMKKVFMHDTSKRYQLLSESTYIKELPVVKL